VLIDLNLAKNNTQDAHAVLKKYWVSISVFRTLKKHHIWPKCALSI